MLLVVWLAGVDEGEVQGDVLECHVVDVIGTRKRDAVTTLADHVRDVDVVS